MPAPVLFLEQNSGYEDDQEHAHALLAAKELIKIIRLAKKANRRLAINSAVPLRNCNVSLNWTISGVLSGHRYKEEWDYLRSIADQSPLSKGFEEALRESVSYDARTSSGASSQALTFAWMLQSGTVSFRGHADWHNPWITASCETIGEEGQINTTPESIRNFSSILHVEEHAGWLSELGFGGTPTGSELWEERADRFPGIRFLPRVRKDLLDLSTSGAPYRLAIDRLTELSADALRWDGTGYPTLSGKIARGEHENRKKLCYVTDPLIGARRCFDAHAYFTGSMPGRIHFSFEEGRREIIVAYVGYKLDRPISGDP